MGPLGQVGGPPTPTAALTRPALAVAAIASVAAGVIHAAAAANHEGDPLLAWMFGLCAVAQLGWGAAVALRPRPRVLVVGLVINGGAMLVWALTRSLGIPGVDALSEVQAVGRQDLGAALFAGASVLGLLRVLVWPIAPRSLTLHRVGLIAAVALVAALPAVTAEHVHEHTDGEGHDEQSHLEAASATEHGAHELGAADDSQADDHGHAADDVDADDPDHATHDAPDDEHGHSDGDAAAPADHHTTDPTGDGHAADPSDPAGHGHPAEPSDPEDPHGHPTDPTDPTDPDDPEDPDDPHGHPTDPSDPTGPIISIDDPRVTDEQWDAAVALIVSTTSGMSAFRTEVDVLAAGYVSIGDGGEPGEYEHFVNWSYLTDEFELDAAHIESIVMKMNADGTKRVVSAMYILSLGKTMNDVPPLAGALTTWHDHDNLCFEGTQLVGLAANNVCPVGVLVDAPPMLHVWVEANPCGPFAAIDEHGMDCGATDIH